jgi:predicted DNA-binding ribbon-helix-helix protein
MNWLLRERRLRAQGEQALTRLETEFLAEMKAMRENHRPTASI